MDQIVLGDAAFASSAPAKLTVGLIGGITHGGAAPHSPTDTSGTQQHTDGGRGAGVAPNPPSPVHIELDSGATNGPLGRTTAGAAPERDALHARSDGLDEGALHEMLQQDSHKAGGGCPPQACDLEAMPSGEQAMFHAAASGGEKEVLDYGKVRGLESFAMPREQHAVGEGGSEVAGVSAAVRFAETTSCSEHDSAARTCKAGAGSVAGGSLANDAVSGDSDELGVFLDAEDAIVECEVLFSAGVVPDLRPALGALERAGMHASVCAGAKAHFCLLAARLGALGRVFPA